MARNIVPRIVGMAALLLPLLLSGTATTAAASYPSADQYSLRNHYRITRRSAGDEILPSVPADDFEDEEAAKHAELLTELLERWEPRRGEEGKPLQRGDIEVTTKGAERGDIPMIGKKKKLVKRQSPEPMWGFAENDGLLPSDVDERPVTPRPHLLHRKHHRNPGLIETEANNGQPRWRGPEEEMRQRPGLQDRRRYNGQPEEARRRLYEMRRTPAELQRQDDPRHHDNETSAEPDASNENELRRRQEEEQRQRKGYNFRRRQEQQRQDDPRQHENQPSAQPDSNNENELRRRQEEEQRQRTAYNLRRRQEEQQRRESQRRRPEEVEEERRRAFEVRPNTDSRQQPDNREEELRRRQEEEERRRPDELRQNPYRRPQPNNHEEEARQRQEEEERHRLHDPRQNADRRQQPDNREEELRRRQEQDEERRRAYEMRQNADRHQQSENPEDESRKRQEEDERRRAYEVRRREENERQQNPENPEDESRRRQEEQDRRRAYEMRRQEENQGQQQPDNRENDSRQRQEDNQRQRGRDPPADAADTYEKRMQDWFKMKAEHDRLVREREEQRKQQEQQQRQPHPQHQHQPQPQPQPQHQPRPQPHPQRPESLTKSQEELENERKLQDYIRRNTPINLPHGGHRNPASDRIHENEQVRRAEHERHLEEERRRKQVEEESRRLADEERMRRTHEGENDGANNRTRHRGTSSVRPRFPVVPPSNIRTPVDSHSNGRRPIPQNRPEDNDPRYLESRRNEATASSSSRPPSKAEDEEERLKRLKGLPVSATIIVRPNGNDNDEDDAAVAANRTTSSTPPPAMNLRFGEDLDYPGLSPHRRGPSIARFPAPVTKRPPVPSPQPCVWAIVVCCQQHRQQPDRNQAMKITRCFEATNCPGASWDTERRCSEANVRAANEEIRQFYVKGQERNY